MKGISEVKKKINEKLQDLQVERIIRKIIDMRLSYLSFEALSLLASSTKYIEEKGIRGDILETGCALGGSSILLGKLKSRRRILRVYDSFEMMPEPSDMDGTDVHERFQEIKKGTSKGIGKDLYYGYEKDLLNKVKANFQMMNVAITARNIKFIKGYYENSLRVGEPIALAHIDCDWYDSVMVSLERVTPFLSIGGIIIIDDYYYYSGCRKATDDYFSDKKDQFQFLHKERLVIKRLY